MVIGHIRLELFDGPHIVRAPRITLLQPVNLTTKADSFEHRKIRLVERLRKQITHERLLRLVPSLVNDDQIRIILGGVEPRVEEGRLFR